MRFEFATAQKIIFGSGTVGQIPKITTKYGSHIFLVIGVTSGPETQFVDSLRRHNLTHTIYQIQSEPTLPIIELGTLLAKNNKCDLVIGFGGGSALDTGKAIAALATNPGDVMDYMEVIGGGGPLLNTPLPYIAIPTTAGTGAEVTRNAVIGSPEHQVKVSLRSPHMLPRIALVDPELTLTLPPEVTASTGLDALTQLLEAYVSKFSNPITDAFCREGIQRASCSLKNAYYDGSDLQAREDMSLASLLSGLALANAKLGAVHGFAGAIGGMYSAPHGAICAALLPHVVQANVDKLSEESNGTYYLNRFQKIAELLTSKRDATIEDGINWLYRLVHELDIPPLSIYGVSIKDIPEIIEKASKSSSMKGNPITLNQSTLNQILLNSI